MTELFLGIDIGSTSTDAVVLDSNNEIVAQGVIDTHPDHKKSTALITDIIFGKLSEKYHKNIDEKDIKRCVGTGYGRDNIAFAVDKITEINCHAKGINYFYPQARTIIDIGGQDSKVIAIDENGNVKNFSMNEKCAAGTGRFLEVLCEILDVELDDLGDISKGSMRPSQISSMCTVFAESEVISKIAEGIDQEAIVKGVHSSVSFRVLRMGKRVGIELPVAFTGGVAKNTGMIRMMAEQIGIGENEILLAPDPQIIGALGAAVYAKENYIKIRQKKQRISENSNLKFLLEKAEIQKTGPVIGWTDLSVPLELLAASGLSNVRIRGDADVKSEGDIYFQTFLCAYIKNAVSSLSEKKGKYSFVDGFITTNCCVATEKMFDIFEYDKRFEGRFIHSLTVPRKNDELAVNYMKNNILKLRDALINKYNVEVSDNELRDVCKNYNEIKDSLSLFSKLLAEKNIPKSAFYLDKEVENLWLTASLTDFSNILKNKISNLTNMDPLTKKGPNVMLMGSIIPDLRMYDIFKDLPCQIICNNTSTGNKFFQSYVDCESEDIYEAISKRCLYAGYNPRMMDVDLRLDSFRKMIIEFEIEAVVFNISKFCVYYTFESVLIKHICDENNIPVLIVETDFTNKGFGQLKTRIEAFIEMLK